MIIFEIFNNYLFFGILFFNLDFIFACYRIIVATLQI